MDPTDYNDIPANERYTILSHPARRRVLEYLEQCDGQTSIDEIVDHLCNREDGSDADRLRIGLHHNHLPRLDEGGVLSYDQVDGKIRIE